MVTLDLNSCQIIVVWGGGRGIGLALADILSQRYQAASVYVSYRSEDRSKDLLDMAQSRKNLRPIKCNPLNGEDLITFNENIKAGATIDLMINSIGLLHGPDFGPEKSLRDMDLETMTRIFSANAFITPLIGKVFKNRFSKTAPSVFATLSAKLASIGDNSIGGWYSYRASKTALNMFIKNMSIEFERAKIKTCLLAIHPGTTETDLSRDFISGVGHKVWQPHQTAEHILEVISNLPEHKSGLFLNWDGQELPW